MKRFIFTAIAAMTLLSSCQKTTPSVSVTPLTAEVPVSGGTVSVDVTSNGEWRTSTYDDGIAVNPSSGSGNMSVTITVPANASAVERDLKVRFFSADDYSISQNVIIHQNASSISVTPQAAEVPVSGGTISVDVTCEGIWKTFADDGITVSPSSFLGNKSVTITVPENTSDRERDVEVKFYLDQNPSVSGNVTIHQKAHGISVTPQDTIVSGSGGDVIFNVTADGAWGTTADNDISVTPSSGSGNGSVRVTVPANITGRDRSVRVKFYLTKSPDKIYQYVTITQKSIDIEVELGKTSASASGDDVTFTVTTSGAWGTTITTGSGVTVSPSSGSGTQSGTIHVPKNTTGETKGIKVKFYLMRNPEIFKEVTITQESIDIEVELGKTSASASSDDVTFTVTTSGAWGTTITTGSGVTVSPSSGSGTQSGTIHVPENTTGVTRYVKVKFYLTQNPEIFKEVTITQKSIDIEVELGKTSASASGDDVTFTVTTSGAWGTTITTGSGVTVSPSSGSGTQSGTIHVPENTTGETRDIKVKFYLTQNPEIFKEVTITQESIDINVELGKTSASASSDDVTFTVTTFGAWGTTITTGSGVTVSPSSGSGTQSGTIHVPENTTGVTRYVKVKFYLMQNPAIFKEVTITQESMGISVSPDMFDDVPAVGGEYKVNVISDGKWTAGDLHGCTLDKTSGSSGESVSIRVSKNGTADARTVTVKFWLTDYSAVSKTVTFYQKTFE